MSHLEHTVPRERPHAVRAHDAHAQHERWIVGRDERKADRARAAVAHADDDARAILACDAPRRARRVGARVAALLDRRVLVGVDELHEGCAATLTQQLQRERVRDIGLVPADQDLVALSRHVRGRKTLERHAREHAAGVTRAAREAVPWSAREVAALAPALGGGRVEARWVRVGARDAGHEREREREGESRTRHVSPPVIAQRKSVSQRGSRLVR